jgi:hypothetical protein
VIRSNVEQEFTKDIGAFLWVGYPVIPITRWQFTEIDGNPLALGMQVKGPLWNRPKEKFGLTEILDDITPTRIC